MIENRVTEGKKPQQTYDKEIMAKKIPAQKNKGYQEWVGCKKGVK